MKTIIVSIPDKDENLLIAILKKFRFKTRVLSQEEQEEMAMAKWIDEGMESEDIPEEAIYKALRKRGVKTEVDGVYPVSTEQKKAIEQGLMDIREGRVYSQREADKVVKEWFKGK